MRQLNGPARTAICREKGSTTTRPECRMADLLRSSVSLRRTSPGPTKHLHAWGAPISVGLDLFPLLVSQRTITIWKVSLYLRGHSIETGSRPPLTVHAPSAAYAGPDKPQPAIPWEPVDAVKTAQTQSRILQPPVPAPALSDALLAFWWRLTSRPDRP